MEEELERQKARLKEAGALRAEAQEVGDAELVEEATQAEQRIEVCPSPHCDSHGTAKFHRLRVETQAHSNTELHRRAVQAELQVEVSPCQGVTGVAWHTGHWLKWLELQWDKQGGDALNPAPIIAMHSNKDACWRCHISERLSWAAHKVAPQPAGNFIHKALSMLVKQQACHTTLSVWMLKLLNRFFQAGVKQREAELARLKAPPQPAGSVAQALSLRERLKKLQAAEAQRTAGGAPLTKQSSVASEASALLPHWRAVCWCACPAR